MPDEQFTEEWRPVVGYEGWYSISNLGRVRRESNYGGATVGRILRPANTWGYPGIVLCRKGQSRTKAVHIVVAAAFIGERPHGKQVNHKDGDKTNPRPSNLEYVTPRENVRHAIRTGLSDNRGEKNYLSKLTNAVVIRFRSEYAAGKTTMKALAIEARVDPSLVSLVISRKIWKHV